MTESPYGTVYLSPVQPAIAAMHRESPEQQIVHVCLQRGAHAPHLLTYATEAEEPMYHYDPTTALEELNEDAVLPNPVRLRDMLLRAHLDADHSLEYNRLFVEYQKRFGELQKLGRQLLEGLGAGDRK